MYKLCAIQYISAFDRRERFSVSLENAVSIEDPKLPNPELVYKDRQACEAKYPAIMIRSDINFSICKFIIEPMQMKLE
jgi:hypothetical protein